MSDVQITIGNQDDAQVISASLQETQIVSAVPGVQGPAGEGVPGGGTTNQVLFKQSDTSYDTAWSNVTSAMIGDLEIVNADVASGAAIAGTKISPNFGSQNVLTTGTSTAASFIPSSSSVPANGFYLPSANNVAISTNGTGRLFVDASGNVSIGLSSSTTALNVTKTSSGTDSNTLLVQNRADATGTTASIYFSTNTAGTGIERSAAIKGISGSGTATELALFSNEDSASPAERLRITSDGKLGLGTSSPSGKLDIVTGTTGNVLIDAEGGSNFHAKIVNDSGDLHLGSRSTSADTYLVSNRRLYLRTGPSESNAVYVSEIGRVGVGTTSPSYLLDVRRSSAGDVVAFTGSTDGGRPLKFVSADVGGYPGAQWTRDIASSNGIHAWAINGSERARIDSSGRLGLGTSSPGVLLDAAGSNPTLRVRATTTNTEVSTIRLTEDNNYVGAYLKYDGSSNLTHIGTHSAADSNAANDNHAITIVRDTRNVGVGTASPIDTLQINKNATNAANAGLTLKSADSNESFLSIGVSTSLGKACITSSQNGTGTVLPIAFAVGASSTDERLRITSDGKLGLGTSAPGALFHAVNTSAGAATLGAVIQNASTTANTETRLGFSPNSTVVSDNRYAYIGAINVSGSNDNSLTFGTGAGAPATERMRIDSSGRVGVGTTNPQYKLVVSNNDVEGIEFRPGSASNVSQTLYYNRNSSVYTQNLSVANTHVFAIDSPTTGAAVTIDSSKRLLVGTSSSVSTYQLEVVNDSSLNLALLTGSNSAASGPFLTLRRSRGSTASPTVVSSGDVTGVVEFRGYSDAASAYLQCATIAAAIDGEPDTAGDTTDMPGRLVFSTTADGASSPTERMRIRNNGDVLINTTSTNEAFFDGTIRVEDSTTVSAFRCTGTSGALVQSLWHQATTGDNQFVSFGTEVTRATRGSITYNRTGGVVAYNTTSDYRAKTILGFIQNPGETIDALKVYRGVMNGAITERPMLIAHEAQEVAPYCVTGEKDAVDDEGNPVYQQMDHQVLVPLLIAEIQQLRARVAALETP